MRLLFLMLIGSLVLFSCTKEKPLQYGDYTAIRAHLRAHLEVFALTESLSKQIEFQGTENFKLKDGGAVDTLLLKGVLDYNDSRPRQGDFIITFDKPLTDTDNLFRFNVNYYRDSLHITGYLDILEIAITNKIATKQVRGELQLVSLDGTTSKHIVDFTQLPQGVYDFEYSGNLRTQLNTGDTAYSETVVPIKNTAWDGSNLFSFIRPWFGESSLYTSKQKGPGRMIWGYRAEYQFRDDFLYVGFPEDNDLQLNMRMQLY
jgi:hypothetical protein